MRFIKQLFNFYINSSIHVALAVYALTWITLLEFGLEYNEPVLYFVFYASITGYNFVKYFGIAKFHYRSLTVPIVIGRLKAIQIVSFISFILMCYYAFQLNKITLFYIAGFGVITFLYAIPFLPKSLFLDKQHNLRSIGGLKIYLIALVWTGVTVFIPLINHNYLIDTNVVITGIQRYIFIIVLMFPFEIRDLQYDSLKLSTIPQSIGIRLTKMIGALVLTVFFFLEFFKDDIYSESIFVLGFVAVVTLLFLMFSKIKQGHYYSSFWVEGLPILWLILLLVFA